MKLKRLNIEDRTLLLVKYPSLCENVPVGFKGNFFPLGLLQSETVKYGKINVMVALVLRPEVFLKPDWREAHDLFE